MDDSELAEAVCFLLMLFLSSILILQQLAKPVGLTKYDSPSRTLSKLTISNSLGNTCYMNATVQALRAIPELQAALNA